MKDDNKTKTHKTLCFMSQQVLYLLSCNPNPAKHHLQEWQKKIFTFNWENKTNCHFHQCNVESFIFYSGILLCVLIGLEKLRNFWCVLRNKQTPTTYKEEQSTNDFCLGLLNLVFYVWARHLNSRRKAYLDSVLSCRIPIFQLNSAVQ